MSESDKLFNKLETMPLGDLMIICGEAINMKMEKKRLDVILLLLETRLQKKRMRESVGLKDF